MVGMIRFNKYYWLGHTLDRQDDTRFQVIPIKNYKRKDYKQINYSCCSSLDEIVFWKSFIHFINKYCDEEFYKVNNFHT